MTPKPGTPETRMTRAPPPHLVIRTIRDWAGVRMDDRPIRRSVVNRLGDPAPMTEEEKERAREAHLAQASVIASATIAAAQAFQQVLQSSQPATTKEEA